MNDNPEATFAYVFHPSRGLGDIGWAVACFDGFWTRSTVGRGELHAVAVNTKSRRREAIFEVSIFNTFNGQWYFNCNFKLLICKEIVRSILRYLDQPVPTDAQGIFPTKQG
jgi:hypothetical protein